MDVEVDSNDWFKDLKMVSTERSDVVSLCTNPIPSDFCNYTLTKIRTLNFTKGFKLAKAFELTFTDRDKTYECFDGLFSFALKYGTNTLAEN